MEEYLIMQEQYDTIKVVALYAMYTIISVVLIITILGGRK